LEQSYGMWFQLGPRLIRRNWRTDLCARVASSNVPWGLSFDLGAADELNRRDNADGCHDHLR